MDIFPLHLFPPGLAYTAIFASVWLGALLTIIFNLTLGWRASSFIVTGYLVPILLVQPSIFYSILVEAITTFLLFYLLSSVLTQYKAGYPFFGKEVFMIIFLISIVVQVVYNSEIFPWIQSTYQYWFNANLFPEGAPHSYGLIIVALTSHLFYRAGLTRGLYQIIFIFLLVFLIIRYVFIPFTNFNVYNLIHLYTQISPYIEAMPKRYIVLVVTGMVAMHYQQTYSWRHFGVLIPILLALHWYQPLRLVVTFIEAFVIYGIVQVLFNFAIITEKSLEGSKKFAVFFTVSFFYKIALTLLLALYASDMTISSFYGIGYLLSTLLAIKFYENKPILKVIRSLVQILIIGVLLSSIIGFALTLWPTKAYADNSTLIEHIDKPSDQKALFVTLARYKPQMLSMNGGLPTRRQVNNLIPLLNELVHTEKVNDLNSRLVRKQLVLSGYNLVDINDHMVLLYPYRNNLGSYLINLDNRSENTLNIQQGQLSAGLIDLAAHLMGRWNVKMVAVRQPEYQAAPGLIKQLFYRFPIRRLRHAMDPSSTIQLTVTDKDNSTKPVHDIGQLTDKLSSKLPDGVKNGKTGDGQSKKAGDNYTLNVAPSDLIRVLDHSVYKFSRVKTINRPYSLAHSLTKLREQNPSFFAEAGSKQYVMPRINTLRYIDHQVITPLINYAKSADNNIDISSINRYLQAQLYKWPVNVYTYQDEYSGRRYIMISEPWDQSPRLHWGAYVFSIEDKERPFFYHVPYSVQEDKSLSIGALMFQRQNGLAMLINNAHPYTQKDRSADVHHYHNIQTFYNMVNQALLRETPQNYLPVVIRQMNWGMTDKLPKADILLRFYQTVWQVSQMTPAQKRLYQQLISDHYELDINSGSNESAYYDAYQNAQLRFLPHSGKDDMAFVWLSPMFIAQYNFAHEPFGIADQLQALGFSTEHKPLASYLQDQKWQQSELSENVTGQIDQLMHDHNINHLVKALKAGDNITLTRVIDTESLKAYLAVLREGRVVAVRRLKQSDAPDMTIAEGGSKEQIQSLTDKNWRWLIIGEK